MKILVTLILLTLFLSQRVIWSISDPRSLPDRLSWIRIPLHLITSTITMGSGILAIILYFKDYYLITEYEDVVTFIGIIITLIGSLFASWARLNMGKFWAPANTGHNEYQNHLHTSGPFKYSRNPIYLGLLVASFGYFLALNSYLIVTVGLIYWYFNKSIRLEETLLEKRFGESYKKYKKITPRLLIK